MIALLWVFLYIALCIVFCYLCTLYGSRKYRTGFIEGWTERGSYEQEQRKTEEEMQIECYSHLR